MEVSLLSSSTSLLHQTPFGLFIQVKCTSIVGSHAVVLSSPFLLIKTYQSWVTFPPVLLFTLLFHKVAVLRLSNFRY